MYVFYLVNRIVDFEAGVRRLPEIHAALAALYAGHAAEAQAEARLAVSA